MTCVVLTSGNGFCSGGEDPGGMAGRGSVGARLAGLTNRGSSCDCVRNVNAAVRKLQSLVMHLLPCLLACCNGSEWWLSPPSCSLHY